MMLEEVLMAQFMNWKSPDLDQPKVDRWYGLHPGQLPHQAFYWTEGFGARDMTPEFLAALSNVLWEAKDGKTVRENHDVKFVAGAGPGGDPLLRVTLPGALVGSFEAGGKRFVLASARTGSSSLSFFPPDSAEECLRRARAAMDAANTVFDVGTLGGDEAPVPAAALRLGTRPLPRPRPVVTPPRDIRMALPPPAPVDGTSLPEPTFTILDDIEITPVTAAHFTAPRRDSGTLSASGALTGPNEVIVIISDRTPSRPPAPKKDTAPETFLAQLESSPALAGLVVLTVVVIGIVAIALSIQ